MPQELNAVSKYDARLLSYSLIKLDKVCWAAISSVPVDRICPGTSSERGPKPAKSNFLRRLHLCHSSHHNSRKSENWTCLALLVPQSLWWLSYRHSEIRYHPR